MSGVVVRVRFGSRRQLRQAFQRELTHAQLFVRTDSPLAVGTAVPIVLELHDGQAIDLQGEVAAARLLSEARAGAPAGMHVRLLDFTPAKRARIEEVCKRPSQHAVKPPPSSTVVPPFEQLIRALRRVVFLAVDPVALRAADRYQVLGVQPDASPAEVRDACAVLRTLLDPDAPPEGLRLLPGHHERLAELRALVLDIEKSMTSPELRADYDALRAGINR